MADQSTPVLLVENGIRPLNKFHDITRFDLERPWPKRVYAFAESSENISGKQHVKFSAVDADWLDEYFKNISLHQSINEYELLREAELWILEFIFPQGFSRQDLNGAGVEWNSQYDGRYPYRSSRPDSLTAATRKGWWHIVLQVPGQSTGALNANLYQNLFASPNPISIRSMSEIDDRNLLRLLSLGNPIENLPAGSIKDVTGRFRAKNRELNAEHVAIYDVGQGSCAAVIAKGFPQIYIDFGGGVLGNSGTFPGAMTRFCFRNEPDVILSHWDWDHWSSAYRDRRALSLAWFIPRQGGMGHVHRAFAADVLLAGGRLIPVPSGASIRLCSWLRIERCTGSNRNGSGIAAVIYPPEGSVENPILLPGDAGLRQIKSVVDGIIFDSMTCSHHGGKMYSAFVPRCPGANHSVIAYSYGQNNTYRHVLPNTRLNHHAAGWTDASLTPIGPHLNRETAHRHNGQLGHIAVGWAPIPVPTAMRCGGQCSLSLQQS